MVQELKIATAPRGESTFGRPLNPKPLDQPHGSAVGTAAIQRTHWMISTPAGQGWHQQRGHRLMMVLSAFDQAYASQWVCWASTESENGLVVSRLARSQTILIEDQPTVSTWSGWMRGPSGVW